MARWRAALPAMLPLGGGMRQERIGGRKRDCVQNDSEICNYRRDIDTGVEHFLTEGAIGWIVRIPRRRLRRCGDGGDAAGRDGRAVNVSLNGKALDRERDQHEQEEQPRQKRPSCCRALVGTHHVQEKFQGPAQFMPVSFKPRNLSSNHVRRQCTHRTDPVR